MRRLNRNPHRIRPNAASSLSCERDIKRAARENRLFTACAAFFIAGIAAGALVYSLSSGALRSYLDSLVSGAVETRAARSFFISALCSLASKAAALLLCLILSYCTVGAPLLPLLIASSGAGTGILGGYVFTRLGLFGALFNLLVVAPAAAIFAFGLINLAIRGIRSSVALYSIAYLGRSRRLAALNEEIYHALAIAAAAAFVSSLLEAALMKLFGGSLL